METLEMATFPPTCSIHLPYNTDCGGASAPSAVGERHSETPCSEPAPRNTAARGRLGVAGQQQGRKPTPQLGRSGAGTIRPPTHRCLQFRPGVWVLSGLPVFLPVAIFITAASRDSIAKQTLDPLKTSNMAKNSLCRL